MKPRTKLRDEQVTDLIPAASELLTFIRGLKDIRLTAFCEEHGLDRFKVQKALKGQLLSIDVDFAFAVEKATGGAVAAEGWCIDEAARDELRKRRADSEEKAKSGTPE